MRANNKIEYDEINASLSKGVMDEIDAALSDVYSLSSTELDFLVNYDLKYRVGSEAEDLHDAQSAAATN